MLASTPLLACSVHGAPITSPALRVKTHATMPVEAAAPAGGGVRNDASRVVATGRVGRGRSACRTLREVDVAGVSVDEEALAAVCRRYGVTRLEVFGSVGRNDPRPDSDIDMLYELAPEARLGWRIEDLADELSATLGRRVDLVSRNALHERLREKVLSEARLLYAA